MFLYWCILFDKTKTKISLPFLFVLVQADAARAEGHNEQEAADDRHGLEEVVLEEVVQRLVRLDHPERVGQEVDNGENDD